MMSCTQAWPEPIVRVQQLSDSGIRVIPPRYVKKPSERPSVNEAPNEEINVNVNIPVIDMQNLYSSDEALRRKTADLISAACKEWGFFQVVNHGVSHQLMAETREVWRQFFRLPLDVKQRYANLPATYEGYGSRLGIEKGACLDWSDYFFLHFLPTSLRDENKWPCLPVACRELVAEYGEEVVKLGGKLMKIFSVTLGLNENRMLEGFGGQVGACLRANYYPKCPQPDLTLGISPHSDPGGMTLLLPDDNVTGLQVRHDNKWITVKPLPNAFIINIGDQIQVLSNAIYKSVEHRVMVNSEKERVSLAFFYNPKSDILIKPLEELVTQEKPALYPPMTYDEYRVYIRTRGPCGKSQVESLKNPNN